MHERRVQMQAAGAALDEESRLQALWDTGLLDTPPSLAFNRITGSLAALLHVPVVVLSLVDERRNWFLSKVGVDVPETPRDVSFDGHVVAANRKLHIVDAWQDERFQGNPLVTGEPRMRAYLGVPVHAEDGQPVGTLAVLDRRAREFTPAEQHMLERYARAVEQLIQQRRN